MITLGSLFDGISGFCLAGKRVGITSIWASEIEPFPMKVSDIRFPEMKQYGDITKLNGSELELVDIITGGSPCQDLSIAGKRAGLAGARSGLFMEQIRIVKELRQKYVKRGRTAGLIRPRFMVWENVPGAFSSNKGEDFRAVLEETAKIADETVVIPGPPKGKWNTVGTIMGDGWSIAWRILDAQYWGVPQRRRRIFLVADFGGQSAPEILFKREGLSRHLAEGREERQGVTTDIERGVNKAISIDRASFNSGEGLNRAPCVSDDDIAHTLISQGPGAVFVQKAIAIDCNNSDSRFKLAGGVMPTLTTRIGTGGNNRPMVATPTYCIQGNCIDRADTAGCNGKGWKEDVCYTLNTIDRPAVAYGADLSQKAEGICFKEEIATCVNTETHGGHGNNVVTLGSEKQVTGTLMANCATKQWLGNQEAFSGNYSIIQNHLVRRLTPLECERLQDFPDGWTDISSASDSARYKALGNSVAVCCPEYVLEGIKEVLEGV